MEWLVIVLIVGGALTYAAVQFGLQVADKTARHIKASDAAKAQRAEAIRSQMEKRTIELLMEFSSLDDSDVALLLHDELVNARVSDPAYFAWANAAHVGRIRRTLLVEAARASRKA